MSEAASAIQFRVVDSLSGLGISIPQQKPLGLNCQKWASRPSKKGDFPLPQDQITCIQLQFTQNPSPTQSSRSSFNIYYYHKDPHKRPCLCHELHHHRVNVGICKPRPSKWAMVLLTIAHLVLGN